MYEYIFYDSTVWQRVICPSFKGCVCVKFSFYVSNVAKRGESFVGDD